MPNTSWEKISQKYICLILSLGIIIGCTASTIPKKTQGEAILQNDDSTFVCEWKINDGDEVYTALVMQHSPDDAKSLKIYKTGTDGSLINLYYIYGEYVDSASFTVMDQDKIYGSNFLLTPQGEILFCFLGQGNYTDILMLSKTKPPVYYESSKGCFLYEKQKNRLIWDSGGHLSEKNLEEVEMEYFTCILSEKVQTVAIVSNNPAFDYDMNLCNGDGQYKTLEANKKKVLDFIRSGNK
jgi:hypothetical protein